MSDRATASTEYLQRVLEAWQKRHWRCRSCLLNNVVEGPHFAYGTINTPIMIIAQSPGGEGREEGPRTQEKLDLTIEDSYLQKGEWDDGFYLAVLGELTRGTRFSDFKRSTYYTNAVKCPPSRRISLKEPGNLSKALHACQVYLRGEIASLDPLLIIAFGHRAARAVLDYTGLSDRQLPSRIHRLRFETPDRRRRIIIFAHWASRRGDRSGYYREINADFREEVGLPGGQDMTLARDRA